MEVCSDQAVAQLHGRWQHFARTFQHDPHAQVSAVRLASRQRGLQTGKRNDRTWPPQETDFSQSWYQLVFFYCCYSAFLKIQINYSLKS